MKQITLTFFIDSIMSLENIITHNTFEVLVNNSLLYHNIHELIHKLGGELKISKLKYEKDGYFEEYTYDSKGRCKLLRTSQGNHWEEHIYNENNVRISSKYPEHYGPVICLGAYSFTEGVKIN
jgi:hypothetical protein